MRSQACGFVTAAAVLGLGLLNPVQAETSSEALARKALSNNRSEATHAIAELRNQGLSGLQTFFKVHDNELKGQALPTTSLRTALDTLCQQRDCYASRLYWYTDFEKAKAAAKATGKPILSLRLLGRLDQELSCANSRFFRIALYPNAEVSKTLRDRFILHWQSVRPAPKVTIDFGDGRKLERTVTGNSIHYILDKEGRPIDALPGLYGPQAFLQHLQRAEKVATELSKRPEGDRLGFLRQYHRDRLAAIQTNWASNLKQLEIQTVPSLTELPRFDQPVDAQTAGQLAFTKSRVEDPLTMVIMGITVSSQQNREQLEKVTDSATWMKIAQLYNGDAKLDRNSQALMRSKNAAYRLSQQDKTTRSTSDPLQPVIQNFETAMALDGVRNEYLFHSQLHQWFVQGVETETVEALNNRVYAQLFLTPNADPWLGLLPRDAYSAIEGDGILTQEGIKN